MNFTTGLRSSDTDEWATPPELFKKLDNEFNFTLDACANDKNHKCPRYYTKETDGLKQNWTGERVFLNPPYGKQIGEWTRKAYLSALEGAIVVAILPARTETIWFQRDVMNATELRFIKGRVKFGGSKNGAPFPSVIAVWGTPKMPIISSMVV